MAKQKVSPWEETPRVWMKRFPMPEIKTERQLETYAWRMAGRIERACSRDIRKAIFDWLEEPMRKIWAKKRKRGQK